MDNPCATDDVGINAANVVKLENFLSSTVNDKPLEEVKLLVAVIEIGQLLEVTKQDGTKLRVLPASIVDQSSLVIPEPFTIDQKAIPCLQACELSFPESMNLSVQRFRLPTVVVITCPKLVHAERRSIELTARSQIFIEPFSIWDAVVLHRWAVRMMARCQLSPQDIEQAGDKIQEVALNMQRRCSPPGSTKRISMGINTYDRVSSHPTAMLDNATERPLLKKQFTLGLFLSQIQLQPAQPFVAYVSVIVTHIQLVDLWRADMMFYRICQSSNCKCKVYSNNPVAIDCRTCNRRAEDASQTIADRSIGFNPQMLGGMSDEDAGFFVDRANTLVSHAMRSNPSDIGDTAMEEQRHQLDMTARAVYGLTGLTKEDFVVGSTQPIKINQLPLPKFTQPHEASRPMSRAEMMRTTAKGGIETRLHTVEDLLQWTRLTLVLGWSGESEDDVRGGRVVVLDVLN